MNCRFCKNKLQHTFIDLVNSPASNSFLNAEQLNEPEVYFPLKVFICENCFLVQIDEYKKSDAIFNNEYVYFSSFSKSWLEHAKRYTEMMTDRFRLGSNSQVVELASNDGYLLQYFMEQNIPVLGIEPSGNTAEVAIGKGIKTIVEFFGVSLASKLVTENIKADVLLGNNVLAHVPDILDFVSGMKILLADQGVITMEFPHLLQLVEQNQFDTIYHEHFSYLSLYTVRKIFEACGLVIFDVEEIETHGGSLRIFAQHAGDNGKPIMEGVKRVMDKEITAGITSLPFYKDFQKKALGVKTALLSFLLEQHRNGKKVAAYGAAAKGNTLLNFCGIKNDLIGFVVDRNPAKQQKWLPGSHIPVVDEAHLKQERPDFVIILPWNIQAEIVSQLSYISEWGGKFVIPIPELRIV